jgi:hypothetical protein
MLIISKQIKMDYIIDTYTFVNKLEPRQYHIDVEKNKHYYNTPIDIKDSIEDIKKNLLNSTNNARLRELNKTLINFIDGLTQNSIIKVNNLYSL